MKLLDDASGVVTVLGEGQCRPGAVRFSPDGRLAAYGSGDGVVHVHDAVSGRTVQVSPPDAPTLSVGFAPDSRWLVVASGRPPTGMTLVAWDGDLVHHVTIAEHVFVNPFGTGDDVVRFSPDARRLLYLGNVTGPFPVGDLTEWRRAGRRATVLERGVAAYVVDEAFDRVAVLAGVVPEPSQPPAVWLHGALEVRWLHTGEVDAIEADVSAQPLVFAPTGALLYLAGPLPGPLALRAWTGGAPITVDEDVFRGFLPGATVALSPCGDEVAYVRGVEPQRFAGTLRVAGVPVAGEPAGSAAAPVSVADDAVPMAFGWAGGTLGYLHAPTSTLPGAAVGTLAAWRVDDGAEELARGVTQVGLAFDGARGRMRYVDTYDAGRAAGRLRQWDAWSGRARTLGDDVFVMSVDIAPDAARAGFVTLTPAPAGSVPATTLEVAPLAWPGPARAVADGVTSLAMGRAGRVVYTTADGLFGAFAP